VDFTVEGLVRSGSLSSLFPAFVGLFACLDFSPCPLFPFLSLSLVLSFYKVWQGFIVLLLHQNCKAQSEVSKPAFLLLEKWCLNVLFKDTRKPLADLYVLWIIRLVYHSR
jgi:hypothetical protein